MEDSYLRLGSNQLLMAAGLIVVNGAISVMLRLGIERTLLLAAVRSVVQLSLVGLILDQVFAIGQWWLVLLLAVAMIAAASVAAVRGSSRSYTGIYQDSFIAMLGSSLLVTMVAVTGIMAVQPWYNPQYVIPLLGMLLGNALTGISLGLDRLLTRLSDARSVIEAQLALGATRWEASREALRDAIRTGMTPIMNTMLVVGIVSLPGMMTGQILAGAKPADAVKYQILVLFMIAATTALGTLGAVLFGFKRLFNDRHQLLYQRIQLRRGS